MQAAEWRALSPDDRIRNISERSVKNFWKRVEKTDSCWVWRGTIARNGYGKYGFCPVGLALAHRISFFLSGRDLVAGMCVCHACDNPACVKPEHLFLGSQKDNMVDCARKDRANRDCKISEETVRLVRFFADLGERKSDIASWVGISRPAVSEIVNFRKWKRHGLI